MAALSSFLIGAAGAGSQILDEERRLRAEEKLMNLRSQNALNTWRVQQQELQPLKIAAEEREVKNRQKLFDYEQEQKDNMAVKTKSREAKDFAAGFWSSTGPIEGLPEGYIPTPSQMRSAEQMYMSGYKWDNVKEDQKYNVFRMRPDGSFYKTLREGVKQTDGAETFVIEENENGDKVRVRAFPRTTYSINPVNNSQIITGKSWIRSSTGQPISRAREIIPIDNATLSSAKTKIDKYFDDYEKSDIFRSGNFDFKQLGPQAKLNAHVAFERFAMAGDPIEEAIQKAVGQTLVQMGVLPTPEPKPGTGELVPEGTSSRQTTGQPTSSTTPKTPQEFVGEVRVAYANKTGKKISIQDMDRLATEGDPDMMEIVKQFDPNNQFGIIKETAQPQIQKPNLSTPEKPNTGQAVASEEEITKNKPRLNVNDAKARVLRKAIENKLSKGNITEEEAIKELERIDSELEVEDEGTKLWKTIADKLKNKPIEDKRSILQRKQDEIKKK